MNEESEIELRKWCLMCAHDIDRRKFNIEEKATPEELIEVAKKLETYIRG